jgi:glutamine kinase
LQASSAALARAETGFAFGTKAETLERLARLLDTAVVMPLDYFTEAEWRLEPDAVVDRVFEHDWAESPLVVRSSCPDEDTAGETNAGRYHSDLDVRGREQLRVAIERVLDSYERRSPKNQVLVQPQLKGAIASGVASSYDPTTGGPYRVVSWSEGTDTTTVTAGDALIRTWYCLAYADAEPPSPALGSLLPVIEELEAVTGCGHLEFEFGVAVDGTIVLFQARRLAGGRRHCPVPAHRKAVDACRRALASLQRERPPALGTRTAFGIMPDWNPAEMIGVRPRPLSLSLYRNLITDAVWAESRARYGYRDVQGVELLVDLCGLPYVDVRASFTSFVPQTLDDDAATRLVEHYVETLRANPHLHDKIEFEIALSSYDLGTRSRADGLVDDGVLSRPEAETLVAGLRDVTLRMLGEGSPYRQDLETIHALARCSLARPAWPYSRSRRITALLNLCRRQGTLPFAGLARAAFAAVALVRSFVAASVLSAEDGEALLGSANEVTVTLRRDFATLDRATFLERHGYLRPGSYDILSPRYDESADHYFDWSTATDGEVAVPAFEPTASKLGEVQLALDRSGLACDAATLLAFVRESVAAREYAKAQFSRLLSEVLLEARLLGEDNGFDADAMSYATIGDILALPGQSPRSLGEAIEAGRARHAVTETMCAPALLLEPGELASFVAPENEPNFVTTGRVTAQVADVDSGDPLRGAVALVRSADPGYDWIFTHGIAGLVTAFGGANSHMALRALELGIPAVIGVGEPRFERWLEVDMLEIDAAARIVRPAVAEGAPPPPEVAVVPEEESAG